jgi:hypothetical protein
MKHTAKGDVVQLCVYTRDLLAKLRAAGEDKHDLLINLLEALKQVPNHHFQRWLNTRIDLWSTKQIDWQPDDLDLMQEAEGYYLELKTENMWSRRTDGSLYVNSTEMEDQENAITAGMEDVEGSCWKQGPSLFGKDIAALTMQLKKYNRNANKKGKKEASKWKYTEPKAGESSIKVIRDNGMKRMHYWCEFHNNGQGINPQNARSYPSRPGSKEMHPNLIIDRRSRPIWRQKRPCNNSTCHPRAKKRRPNSSSMIQTLIQMSQTPLSTSQRERTPTCPDFLWAIRGYVVI